MGVKIQNGHQKPVFRQLLKNELGYFQNSNGNFSSLMAVISKKYRFEKSTSGLVEKIQNGRRKPVFRQ